MSPNLTSGIVTFTLIGFLVAYVVLAWFDIYLMKTYAAAGLSGDEQSASIEPEMVDQAN